ncbi:MAG: hypothetical protein ACRCWR_04575 [Saezia sp.]
MPSPPPQKRLFIPSFFALSLTLVVILLSVYYPHWYYSCVHPEDGAPFAMYGFPLPYLAERSSLNYASMPH